VTPTDQHDRRRLLDRPLDPDTFIRSFHFFRINGIPFLLERWNFDGIRASSAVFLSEHVAGMDDAELQAFLIEQAGVDLSGSVTISRRESHTFVNFGFEA
jgi:hypothetical protein